MIRKIPVLVALTLFAPGLVASAGEGRSSSSSGPVTKNAPVIRKIDDRMREFVKANQAAGIVTAVVHRGRLIHSAAVGLADLSGNRPILPDSVFAIASMTKPVTAAAVMILRDEGKLDLDDPVSKYVPAFRETRLKGGAKPMREVTLRDCLRHTSGLQGDQRNRGSLAETAEFLARTQLDFEPGSKWQYGPGLSVVGRVVEVVSGMPFDQFLKERVFGPLEMSETTFKPTSEQLKRLAKVYQPSTDKQNLQPFNHWILDEKNWTSPNPSGGLFSTAADIVRFHQMLLNQGELNGRRILSRKAVQEMTSLQTGKLKTGFTPGCGWGLGVCLVQQPQGPTKMLSAGTFGHGGAFGTQGWIDPQQQLICILLVQRANFGNGDGSELRSELQRLAVEAIAGESPAPRK